jgi:hypothetical protein
MWKKISSLSHGLLGESKEKTAPQKYHCAEYKATMQRSVSVTHQHQITSHEYFLGKNCDVSEGVNTVLGNTEMVNGLTIQEATSGVFRNLGQARHPSIHHHAELLFYLLYRTQSFLRS